MSESSVIPVGEGPGRGIRPPLDEFAGSTWGRLRQAFYTSFSGAMAHAVECIGSPPRACWCDFSGSFNHVWLYPFLSPTPSRPDMPWIARLAVNILDPMLVPGEVARRLCVGSWYPDWHLELTLLPEELADFAPWLAQLASAHDELWSARIPAAPRPLQRPLEQELMLDAAALWTTAALARYDEFCENERQREERMRRRVEYELALLALSPEGPAQLPPPQG